jgi:hypothetical protein
VLKVDDDTGANDLVMDATNNQTLYATTYQRRRTACCMNGGGPGSGIWKSADDGETWTRLKGGGLPDDPLGRIAMDASRRRPLESRDDAHAGQRDGSVPIRRRGRHVAEGERREPAADVLQPGAQRSQRSGRGRLRRRRAAPLQRRRQDLDITESTHDDVHAIWIDPSNSNHIIIGNDGGLAVSWDQARTWNFLPNLPVGLFYHVSVDNATPYDICGGMQDNYSWCGPSAVRGSAGIAGFHWATMQGGDGFVALQDPSDYRIAYSESQDGNMVRIDRVTSETVSMRPSPDRARRRSAGTGTRRSSCRRTTRASSTPSATRCSARRIAARPGKSSAATSRRTPAARTSSRWA